MQGGKLVESRGGQEDLAAVVCFVSFGAGHHGDGVAAVVLIEATGSTCARHHCALVHVGGIVVVEGVCGIL